MTMYAGGEEVPEFELSYLSGLLSAVIVERQENLAGRDRPKIRFVAATSTYIDVDVLWKGAFEHEAPLRITIGPRPT